MIPNANPQAARVLITGATGFLGQAVAKTAVQRGLAVRCTGRTQKPENLPGEYCQADLLVDDLQPVLQGIELLIHTAGLAHVFDKSKSDEPFMAINARGTERLAKAASEAGVRHMVLASSVSVYGGNALGKCDERSPCNPRNAYARSKYEGERLASKFCGNGMGLTILRLATLFGPGDPGNVARLLSSIDRGSFFWIGRGSNLKSLVYRDDAAEACLEAVLASNDGVQIYNVSAPARPMREIVGGLAEALEKPPFRFHFPARLAWGAARLGAFLCLHRGPAASLERTIRTWLADDVYLADLIEQEIGWRSQTPLENGLRNEVDWYKASGR